MGSRMTVNRWALLLAAGVTLVCVSLVDIRPSLAAEPQGRPGENGSHEAARAEATRSGALAALRDESEAASELDRMIGQMILVGFLGSSARDAGVIAVHDQLKRGTVGGVLLFPDNIRSPGNLRALTDLPCRCQPIPLALHRRRSGRRPGAAAVAAERPRLLPGGAKGCAQFEIEQSGSRLRSL